jgi:hypothetical protein
MGSLLYDVGVDPSLAKPGSSATLGLVRKSPPFLVRPAAADLEAVEAALADPALHVEAPAAGRGVSSG